MVLWIAPFSWAQTYEQRLQACSACHGPNGNSQMPDVPSLAAQPRLFIENQLVLIREGVRDIPAMKALLDGVGDDDLAKMARHFSSQSLVPAPRARDEALLSRGQQLAEQTRCGICHLPTYLGREQMPRLAGQREDYLFTAMRMMQANQAVGRDPIMSASVYGIPEADLKALSHYFAHIKP
ncbi:MAG: c-type cytochrome [Alphaproteobacteria bacterium]|nr:c-type cytochrome [Alphaproteobacteria bacterium]